MTHTITPQEARREYQRKWRERNRDKLREYEARHWEKVAAAYNAKVKEAEADGQREEE